MRDLTMSVPPRLPDDTPAAVESGVQRLGLWCWGFWWRTRHESAAGMWWRTRWDARRALARDLAGISRHPRVLS